MGGMAGGMLRLRGVAVTLRGAAAVGAVYAVTLTAFATVTWLQFWAHR